MATPVFTPWMRQWQLTPDGEAFETPSSHLCLVRRGDTRAILKIYKPGSDEQRAPQWLRLHAGAAVRVLEADDAAVLLERVMPGEDLCGFVQRGLDSHATHIICDVVAQLYTAPSTPRSSQVGWPTLEDWGNAFTRQRTRGAHPLLHPEWVDAGEAMFFDLCKTQRERHVLHGDLHHRNILRDDARGWLVIDPKGVTGEIAYEPATTLHNPTPHDDLYANANVMERRVAIYAQRLSIAPERILRWCFAQCVLSACWHVEDGSADEHIARVLRTAQTAHTLLTA